MTRRILLFLAFLKFAYLLNTGVYKESDVAEIIVVHEPTLEANYFNLHPEASNNLETMNLPVAQLQHKEMQKVIATHGAKVYVLRDVLLNGTENRDGKEYKDLLALASEALRYNITCARRQYNKLRHKKCDNEEKAKTLDRALNSLKPQMSFDYQEKYRLAVLRNLSTEELIDIILTRPTVELRLRNWWVGNHAVVDLYKITKLNPLGDLYFMRDQQITTRKGIVILKSRSRANERKVTEFVFKKLGLNVIGKLSNGFAEGGDYIPFGDLAFIGVGLRSDYEAIKEIMENDWFGVPEIAVVRDETDLGEDRMHLDTFFNILNDKGSVLLLDDILSHTKIRRHVDLYSNQGTNFSLNSVKFGDYSLVQKDVDFGYFLKKRGFKITIITAEEQLNFANNFLNIGQNTIVTPYCGQSYVERLKRDGINVICVNLDQLIKGYGAVHCMTQVVYRKRN